MKLAVKARVSCQTGFRPALVGSAAELGSWQPTQAIDFVQRQDGLWQLKEPVVLPRGTAVEFKLLQRGERGDVLWEPLPQNKNRKYVLRDDVVLTMQWGSSIGQRKKMKQRSVSTSTFATMMIAEPITRSTTMMMGTFDPFKIAEHSDEEDDQELARATISAGLCNYGKKQFDELFYSNVGATAMVKELTHNYECRLFVVSRNHPTQNPHAKLVQEELIKEGLAVNWIVQACEEYSHTEGSISFVPLRRKSGGLSAQNLLWLFERYIQELPNCSVVMVVDPLFASLKVNKTVLKCVVLNSVNELDLNAFNHSPANTLAICLNVQATKSLPISEAGLDPHTAKLFYQFIESLPHQANSTIRPACEFLRLRSDWQIPSRAEPTNSIEVLELQNLIDSNFNSILVFDWDVIESCMEKLCLYYDFLDGLRTRASQPGEFVIVVSEKSLAELESKLGFLLVSNIALFLNGGRDIRMNGTWIHPYQKLDQDVEAIYRLVQRHQKNIGGEVIREANRLVYHSSNNGDMLGIYRELTGLVGNSKYLRVSCQDHLIAVSWEYDFRTALEVVLRLNCMSQGSVGFVLAVVRDQRNSFVFDCFNYFAKIYPYFFTQHCKKIFACEGTKRLRSCTTSLLLEDLRSLKFLPQ